MADSIADCTAAEPLVASSGAAEPVLDLTCHPTICPGLYEPRCVRVFILGWNGMHRLSREGWPVSHGVVTYRYGVQTNETWEKRENQRVQTLLQSL